MFNQIPFGTDDFAENPETRIPCVLALDVSASMSGAKVEELRKGLEVYRYELLADPIVAKRVEIAVITFGGKVTVTDWATPDRFFPPVLQPDGNTPMGEAITQAVSMLKERKAAYRANGVMFYRPWIFLITDGEPTDSCDNASVLIRTGESKREFSFFCVGVEDANMAKLSAISVREPLKLKGLRFADLFLWLSNSQQSVSQSQPGDEVALINPTLPSGWASI